MRKQLGMFLVIMILMTSVNVTGQEGFSSWAEDEGSLAVKQGLVPTSLNSNYQNNIKRYEYVLLALEILELNNRSVNIDVQNPFIDISGHEYEDEIVLAYNAGIVNGDGLGNFYPNKDITRQEISVLVCNLTKAIDEETDIFGAKSTTYADTAKISNWALAYVNYCYENDIMKGVGSINGLDEIAPKGTASREQAILLLFRLAKIQSMFNSYELSPISIVTYDSNGNEILGTSDVISDFANETSLEIAKDLSAYAKESSTEVLSLTDNYFKLSNSDDSKIILLQTDSLAEITMTTKSLDDSDFLDKYLSFVGYYTDEVEVGNIISRGNNALETDKTYKFEEEIADKVSMIVTYSEFSQEYYYKVIVDYRL